MKNVNRRMRRASSTGAGLRRRDFLAVGPAVAGVWATGPLEISAAQAEAAGPAPAPQAAAGPKTPRVVGDRLWAWAHDAGVYNGAWGLTGTSRITPIEGARYLGVPNAILIRYDGKPAPPFREYAKSFQSLDRVYWSLTGAGGATSDEEREQVFRLAAEMPNLAGVFMDDFFHGDAALPQWLAENGPNWPVDLVVRLPRPVRATGLELTQSDWHSGDYRTADFAVEIPSGAVDWREVAKGRLENRPRATARVALPDAPVQRLRLRILGTHDHDKARSCGLSGLRLTAANATVSLADARIEAGSSYAGHPAELLLGRATAAPAALSPEQLRAVRRRLVIGGRRLDLGVTLYTHQIAPGILSHLDLCDVVSLWTWRAEELDHLEANFAKLRALAPRKRILLGCYMWDFGTLRPMPIARMQRQCELGLKWLRAGSIEGMIFLATNLCDLNLETVAWTRRWTAEVGKQPLQGPRQP